MSTSRKNLPLKARPTALTRILIVDDHPLVRERLAEVLHREHDLMVCGEAEDHERALEAVEHSHPDLVIVDLSLKNSHGLDLIRDLHASHPELATLVVSMHDEALHAERVVRAGARGYITKQEATRKIMVAIRTVLGGNVYLSEQMSQRLASTIAGQPRRAPRTALDQLTDREVRVLEFIGQGYGTRQIADHLHLGMSTVETYRARIKEKLRLKDASELLQFAIRWMQASSQA